MQHIHTRRSVRTTAPTFRLQHSRGHGIVENRVLAGCRRAAAGAGSPATTSADLPGHVATPPWYRSRQDRQAAVDSPLDSTWSRDIDDEDDGGGQRWFSVDDEEGDAPDAIHGGQRQSMQMLHVKSNTSRIDRLAKVRSDIQSHTRSKVQTVAAWLTVVKGAKSAGALMQAANALCTLPASELNGDKKLQQAVSGVAVLAGRAVAAWLLEKSNFVARIDVAFQLHGNLQNAAMANSTFRDAFIKLMHASGDEDSTFAESKYVVRHALLQARLHVCCPRFWQRLTAQSPISPPAAAASLLQAYARITKSRCVVADADVAARLIDNVSSIDLSSSQVWAVLWSLAVLDCPIPRAARLKPLERAAATAADMNMYQVSTALWALAQLQEPPPPRSDAGNISAARKQGPLQMLQSLCSGAARAVRGAALMLWRLACLPWTLACAALQALQALRPGGTFIRSSAIAPKPSGLQSNRDEKFDARVDAAAQRAQTALLAQAQAQMQRQPSSLRERSVSLILWALAWQHMCSQPVASDFVHQLLEYLATLQLHSRGKMQVRSLTLSSLLHLVDRFCHAALVRVYA